MDLALDEVGVFGDGVQAVEPVWRGVSCPARLTEQENVRVFQFGTDQGS